MPATVALLVALSGGAALVYQLTWMRRLSLVVGAGHEAVAIVLTSFMLGLALGSFAWGRLVDRRSNPLRDYGLLELGIAACAALLPLALGTLGEAYITFVRGHPGVPPVMGGVFAGALMVVPTALMGATLPVVTTAVTRIAAEVKNDLAILYGANTLGATAGVLGTGFWLLPALGVTWTERVAICINVVVGLAALVLSRRPKEATLGATPAEQASIDSTTALWMTYLGTFVCGFAALGLEVSWTRALTLAIGSSTYSFTVLLMVFIGGISIGSSLQRAWGTASMVKRFGQVVAASGVASAGVSLLIPNLPATAEFITGAMGATPGAVGPSLLVAAAIMLVPAILFGMAFPIAAGARAVLRNRVGSGVGDALGLNTMGAVAGILTTGFVLIPSFGLQTAVLVHAASLVAYGLMCLTRTVAPPRRPIAMGLAALVGAAVMALPPPWKTAQMAGVLESPPDAHPAHESQALFYAEGRMHVVSVTEQGPRRTLHVNGKPVASDWLADLQHEMLLGHLPVLLHAEPASVAVVGLGAGITLAGVAAHDDVKRILLMEIEEQTLHAADHFSELNNRAHRDQRVEVVIGDGRQHLLTREEQFDVITADPIHPWTAGSTYLYTVEYFQLLSERLAEDGLLCQWVPTYELSDEQFRSIVATISTALPHVTIFQTDSDAIVIAGRQPLSIDMGQLERRMKPQPVQQHLSRIAMNDHASLLSTLALAGDAVGEFVGTPKLNTDDNLYLEYATPLFRSSTQRDTADHFNAHRSLVSAITGSNDAGLDEEVRAAKNGLLHAVGMAGESPGVWLRTIAEQRRRHPEYQPLIALESAALVASSFRAKDPQVAQQMLARALELEPENGIARVYHSLHIADHSHAIAELELALETGPNKAWTRRQLARRLTVAGRDAEAVAQYQQILEVRPNDRFARQALSMR